MVEPIKPPPSCLITGKLIGHPDTCGDCDPCGAVHRLPEVLRNTVAEIICDKHKLEESYAALIAAEAERDALKAENERLKTQLAALNDDGALHAAYISGQLDAKAENERLRAALTKIACFDDESANRWLQFNGSYSSFDEPGSVRVARAALTGDDNG